MSSVSIERVIEKLGLTNLTPEVDITNRKIVTSDVNRPALQLAGYFEHFEESRVQIIGFVEYTYMEGMTQAQKEDVYPKVISESTPCFVVPDPSDRSQRRCHRGCAEQYVPRQAPGLRAVHQRK